MSQRRGFATFMWIEGSPQWAATPVTACLWPVAALIRPFSSVQLSSVTHSCPTLCDPMNRSMPGLPVHHQLSKFTQTHVHQVGDVIQPSQPLSSPSPPVPNPSQHQSMRWPKYWSFSFSISPSKEYPGLISFRMDRLDLLEVQDSQESSPTPQFKVYYKLTRQKMCSYIAWIH